MKTSYVRWAPTPPGFNSSLGRLWDVCMSAGRGLTVPVAAGFGPLSRSDIPRFTPALLAFITNPRPQVFFFNLDSIK